LECVVEKHNRNQINDRNFMNETTKAQKSENL